MLCDSWLEVLEKRVDRSLEADNLSDMSDNCLNIKSLQYWRRSKDIFINDIYRQLYRYWL